MKLFTDMGFLAISKELLNHFIEIYNKDQDLSNIRSELKQSLDLKIINPEDLSFLDPEININEELDRASYELETASKNTILSYYFFSLCKGVSGDYFYLQQSIKFPSDIFLNNNQILPLYQNNLSGLKTIEVSDGSFFQILDETTSNEILSIVDRTSHENLKVEFKKVDLEKDLLLIEKFY